ncbi:MAG: type II secretion system F family protein [Acidimicrobiales bacterium]
MSDRRTQRAEVERLPIVLHTVARELRAGRSLAQAIRTVAGEDRTAGPGLRRAVDRIDGGLLVVDALDRWAVELGHEDADLVRAVINAGASTGGAMAAALDRAAGSLHERAELRREIRALSAQARTSALVLTIAPVAFLAVVILSDRSVLVVLATTWAGRACLGAGLVLDAVGWWWMARLAARVAS